LKKINKILDYLSELNLDKDKKFFIILKKFSFQGKLIARNFFNKLEIKKYNLELLKKHYRLGLYISKKYKSNKVQDFSYDEEYKLMNKEIDLLVNYISKLKSSI
jgi:hypothetical protein